MKPRFINNKLLYKKAEAHKMLSRWDQPVDDVNDLHDFYDFKRQPKIDDWQEAAKYRNARNAAYLNKVPSQYHQMVESERFPDDHPLRKGAVVHWSYEPHVMENVLKRLGHMNPTYGEMAMLSEMMRSWNSKASSPGGQYLQTIANELNGREPHEGVRSDGHDDGKYMREELRSSPMHNRMLDLVKELQRQSQEEFRNEHGDNGAVLHRGLSGRYGEQLGQQMDETGEINANPVNSYSHALESARRFGRGNVHHLLNHWEEIAKYNNLPEHFHEMPESRDYDVLNPVARTILSSHVKPENVFLHHNIVGTPLGDEKNNPLSREREVWVNPDKNIPHVLNRYITTSKRPWGRPKSKTVAFPIGSHKTKNVSPELQSHINEGVKSGLESFDDYYG